MIFDLVHVRIRIKLLGLVLLPVVGGGLLSGLQVAQQTRLLDRMARLRAASSASGAVVDLVQALQVESGRTALYLGLKGASHQGDMLAARAETDRRRAALKEAVTGREAVLSRPVLDEVLLAQLRQRADRQGGTQELLDGYGREVDGLLRVEERLLQPAAGTPLEGPFRAFASLMRAKEAAGQEQAILAQAFSQGAFGPGLQDRLAAAADTLKVQGEAFQAAAPEAARGAFQGALAGPSAPEFDRLLAQGLAGKLDQDPEAWSRVAGARLDAIKAVQDQMGRDLLSEAQALEGGARTRRWLLVGGFGVFGLLVLAWTWRATVLITEPIHELAEGMARMEEGDLRIQLPVHSYDETGRMTQAFNAMSARLRELVRNLQHHAGRLGGGAAALSASAAQVSAATGQLAQSARVQREASEEVASAVTQLQASVLQVQASLESMLDGGRDAGNRVRETARQAQAMVAALEAVVQRTEQAVQSAQAIQALAQSGRQILEGPREADTALRLHQISLQSEKAAAQVSGLVEASRAALQAGAARVEAMVATMATVDAALGDIELAAGEIHQAAENQAKVSTEVSHRMEASLAAAGDVQLAAAQLANTAPELVLTSRELVGVAEALRGSAAAFQAE
jgi:methyl-accepting chemotaxis protein